MQPHAIDIETPEITSGQSSVVSESPAIEIARTLLPECAGRGFAPGAALTAPRSAVAA
jgi:hypothetical protein